MNFLDKLSAARAGDQSALHKLVFCRSDELTRFVKAKISAGQSAKLDAEGIVQQALIDAVKKIDDFKSDTEESFGSWLKSIANSRFLDTARKENTAKRGGGRVSNESDWQDDDRTVGNFLDGFCGSSGTPSKIVAREELIKIVKRKLSELPEHYRTAIYLKDIEQMPRKEAAEKMGKSEDEFRGILNRARQQLKNSLGNPSLFQSFC